MFTKPNESPIDSIRETNGAGQAEPTPSVLSADLKVIGDLQCAGDVQVEGQIEGDITSRSVTVGESAEIKGSISAQRVRIGGSVQGEISAPMITIAKTAKIRGDIIHETLTVEAGAYLEGQVRRLEAKSAPAAAPRNDAKPLKGSPPKIVETPPTQVATQAPKAAAG